MSLSPTPFYVEVPWVSLSKSPSSPRYRYYSSSSSSNMPMESSQIMPMSSSPLPSNSMSLSTNGIRPISPTVNSVKPVNIPTIPSSITSSIPSSMNVRPISPISTTNQKMSSIGSLSSSVALSPSGSTPLPGSLSLSGSISSPRGVLYKNSGLPMMSIPQMRPVTVPTVPTISTVTAPLGSRLSSPAGSPNASMAVTGLGSQSAVPVLGKPSLPVIGGLSAAPATVPRAPNSLIGVPIVPVPRQIVGMGAAGAGTLGAINPQAVMSGAMRTVSPPPQPRSVIGGAPGISQPPQPRSVIGGAPGISPIGGILPTNGRVVPTMKMNMPGAMGSLNPKYQQMPVSPLLNTSRSTGPSVTGVPTVSGMTMGLKPISPIGSMMTMGLKPISPIGSMMTIVSGGRQLQLDRSKLQSTGRGTYTVKDLREFLGTLGADKKGNKADLVARLNKLASSVPATGMPVSPGGGRTITTSTAPPSSGSLMTMASRELTARGPSGFTVVDVNRIIEGRKTGSYSRNELKTFLKQIGADTTGNKPALAKRLRMATQGTGLQTGTAQPVPSIVPRIPGQAVTLTGNMNESLDLRRRVLGAATYRDAGKIASLSQVQKTVMPGGGDSSGEVYVINSNQGVPIGVFISLL